MIDEPFECERCGACCRLIWAFEGLLDELSDKDGCCVFLDKEENACQIYKRRPTVCRVDDYFYRHVSGVTKTEYIEATKKCCVAFRQAAYQGLDMGMLRELIKEILSSYPKLDTF